MAQINHASDYVTVSNSFFHDHYKASLIGSSDDNAEENEGHLHVTQNNNYWHKIHSRTPSFRFGTGHIYNSFFQDVDDCIHTRMGAQLLVESNVFRETDDALYSSDQGYAVARNNDFGPSKNKALEGTLTSVNYEYDLLGPDNVKDAVVGTAGQTLTF